MNESAEPTKEGALRKRAGRLQRWSTRYFVLRGSKLSYKMKKDNPNFKNGFDLMPGCAITDITEETLLKGRKIFSFWIVWPHDKNNKSQTPGEDEMLQQPGEESDDEGEPARRNIESPTPPPASSITHKALKDIVQHEKQSQREHQKLIESEVKNHKAQDHNVRLGAKVAAVAAGGAVVGALTAGIGLIPYMAIVGITAAAGGGAIFFQSHSRPMGSRLIVAADTREEAEAWKTAIEGEIAVLDRSLKPMFPSCADPDVISSIIDMNSGAKWKTACRREGMRILEQLEPTVGTICRKAQLAVCVCPFTVFVAVMEGNIWPRNGSVKVEKSIDDHADIIAVTANTYVETQNSLWKTTCSLLSSANKSCSVVHTRTITFARFWKWDDDGIYLITLNSVRKDATAKQGSNRNINEDKTQTNPSNKRTNNKDEDPSIDIIITISPRLEYAEYEDEVPSSLVTCIAQVSTKGNWRPGEVDVFINDLLQQQLLDLRQAMISAKFGPVYHDASLSMPCPISAAAAAAAAAATGGTTSRPNISHSSSVTTRHTRGDKLHVDTDKVEIPSLTRSKSLMPSPMHGVATQQPGLEDASMQAYNHTAAINATVMGIDPRGEHAAKNSPTAMKKSFSMFRRNGKSKETHSTRSISTTDRLTSKDDMAITPEKQKDGTKGKRVIRKSKYHKSERNNDKNKLKTDISMREYEYLRLDGMKIKDPSVTPFRLQQLLLEIRELQAKYLEVTGHSYDSDRGVINSIRTRTIKKELAQQTIATAVSDNLPVATGVPVGSIEGVAQADAVPSNHSTVKLLPSHWMKDITQSNKAKDERLQKSKEHFYSIVQALAGFVVSYVMTLLLRDVVTVYLS